MIPLFFLWDGGATVAGSLICEPSSFVISAQDATFGLTGNVSTPLEPSLFVINAQDATFTQQGGTAGRKRQRVIRPIWPPLEELLARQQALGKQAKGMSKQIEKTKEALAIAETQAEVDKVVAQIKALEARLNKIDEDIAQAEEEEILLLLMEDD